MKFDNTSNASGFWMQSPTTHQLLIEKSLCRKIRGADPIYHQSEHTYISTNNRRSRGEHTDSRRYKTGSHMKPGTKLRLSSPRARTVSCSSTSSVCKKKSTSLPNETVEYLKAWMMSPEHIAHPYPTDAEKNKIMEDTGIELKQLTNWFVNNRKRFWKPRVEAKLQGHQNQSDSQTQEGTHVSRAVAFDSKPRSATQAAQKCKLPRSVSLSDVVATVEYTSSQFEMTKIEADRQHLLSLNPDSSLPSVGSISATDLSIVDGQYGQSQNGNVDEHASVISFTESGSVSHSSSSEDEWSPGHYKCGGKSVLAEMKTEIVDVHILRPNHPNQYPSLDDVTILPHVPQERILRTFYNCRLIYNLKAEMDFETNEDLISFITERRESEIKRLKRECLTACQNDMNETSVSSGMDMPVFLEQAIGSRKRNFIDDMTYASPDSKSSRICVSDDMNNESDNVSYEKDASSLDDAAQLFGFAQALRKKFIQT